MASLNCGLTHTRTASVVLFLPQQTLFGVLMCTGQSSEIRFIVLTSTSVLHSDSVKSLCVESVLNLD